MAAAGPIEQQESGFFSARLTVPNNRRIIVTMKTKPQEFIVDSKGNKTGVVLSLRRYRKLMEDLHDLAVVAERRSEPAISLEELKRRLKKNGRP